MDQKELASRGLAQPYHVLKTIAEVIDHIGLHGMIHSIDSSTPIYDKDVIVSSLCFAFYGFCLSHDLDAREVLDKEIAKLHESGEEKI